METLTAQLKAQNDQARARLPQESLAVMDDATSTLAASGITDTSLAVGAAAPDFTLPGVNGEQVSLAKLLTDGPVVLAFYRGGWCPYCNLELRALQAALADITAAGATLVAISPQLPDNSLSTAEKLELAFPVLSDVGNVVAREYGLVFSLPEDLRSVYDGFGIDLPAANGDQTFELPVPATFVIDRDGSVAWRFVDPDYTHRGDPADVLAAVKAL